MTVDGVAVGTAGRGWGTEVEVAAGPSSCITGASEGPAGAWGRDVVPGPPSWCMTAAGAGSLAPTGAAASADPAAREAISPTPATRPTRVRAHGRVRRRLSWRTAGGPPPMATTSRTTTARR